VIVGNDTRGSEQRGRQVEQATGRPSALRLVLAETALLWMGALVGPALVAVAVAGAIWGIAVAIVVAAGLLLLLAIVVLLFRRSDRAVRWAPPERPAPAEGELRRVLLVASQASAGPQLMREIRFRAREAAVEFFVLCPVLDTPFEHWAGGSDADRELAQQFLRSMLDQLRSFGIKAEGSIGDNEPLVATEDALRRFPADEILIATHPLDRRGWLEHDIVGEIRARCELPITHVLPVIPRDAR
jgi:GABA permease